MDNHTIQVLECENEIFEQLGEYNSTGHGEFIPLMMRAGFIVDGKILPLIKIMEKVCSDESLPYDEKVIRLRFVMWDLPEIAIEFNLLKAERND